MKIKNGDWVFCYRSHHDRFTKGKVYQVISRPFINIYHIADNYNITYSFSPETVSHFFESTQSAKKYGIEKSNILHSL